MSSITGVADEVTGKPAPVTAGRLDDETTTGEALSEQGTFEPSDTLGIGDGSA